MTDLISATLRDRADGDIHIERLLAAVHTGARRQRRRRFVVTACAVVAVASLAAGGVVASSGTREAPARPAESTGVDDIPRPPLDGSAPVAAVSPSVLGTDPMLFHLDLTGVGVWTSLKWSARRGYEELRGTSFETGGELYVEASQARDKLPGLAGEITPTRVNGLPAEAVRAIAAEEGSGRPPPRGNHAVRWEAVPGLWVQVVVEAGPEVAMRIAERVRLDRTFRCAVPFRLTGLGDQVQVIRCEMWFQGSHCLGGVHLTNGPTDTVYREYYVGVGPRTSRPAPTGTIGGRPVTVVPGSGNPGDTARIEYPYEDWVGYFYPFYTTLDDPFLRSLVPAFQPVTDPDPARWPRSPLD